MDRYEELEKLYYKRKYKRIFLYSLSAIITLFLILFFCVTKNDENKNKNIETEQKKTSLEKSNQEIKQENLLVTTKNVEKKEIKNVNKLVLYPIFPEVEIEEENNKENKDNISQDNNDTEIKDSVVKEEEINNIPIIEVNKEGKENIKIVVTSSDKNLDSLLNSYKHSATYDVAIKIANLYFDDKKYEESIEWSKKANKIKPENYKSWYVFAKSLVELGNKNKAKKVLSAYLNSYGDNKEIIKLLRSIK